MGPTPPEPARAEPDRIAFLGFGLIGGSIAMALRARGAGSEIVAWSPTGHGPEEGRRRGLVDVVAAEPSSCVEGAELVVLAGPPLAVLATLDDLDGPLGQALGGATITDVASTKGAILGRANGRGAHFVGGHPMAGSDASGIAAARAGLFEGRPWVVVPGDAATAADIARVEALARLVGAVPVRMSAEAHDAAAAAISHLPLVVAAALVEAVTSGDAWPAARAIAATGWRDMTRLARGDPEMGAGILATNADEVAAQLRALRAAVDGWLAALQPVAAGEPGEPGTPGIGPAQPGAASLRDRLAAARAALDGGSEPGT